MPTIIRQKDLNKNKPKYQQSAKYYNSKLWKSLRNIYIREHPLCENCLKNDITKPVECVHHKQFILSTYSEDERWRLLLLKDNLMSLCNDCHHKMHNYAKQHNLEYIDYLKLND